MNDIVINSVEALLFGSGRPMRLSEIKNIIGNSGLIIELSEIIKSNNE